MAVTKHAPPALALRLHPLAVPSPPPASQVALVLQQAEVLRAHLGPAVAAFVGEMGTELWEKERYGVSCETVHVFRGALPWGLLHVGAGV